MTYQDVLDFLNHQLPMFHKTGQKALKPGLKNILALCEAIGNPHLKFKSVHVAGTNGKGSTSHLLAAAFQENGYKTGLYTSPHLRSVRERIRINGDLVSQENMIEFFEKYQNEILKIEPSYFELLVAIAFDTFAKEKVDIAVVEVGLGGRLDSTNILLPELSVITNIGWDHMDILGDTLQKIAFEKGGIIKENIPVVIGERQEEVMSVFEELAQERNADLYYSDAFWKVQQYRDESSHKELFELETLQGNPFKIQLNSDLEGVFQEKNIQTALAALSVLKIKGMELDFQKVFRSFERVKKNTGLRGRWELLQNQPKVIVDVGHNPPGLKYLKKNLQLSGWHNESHLHIVIGFVKDKDVLETIRFFPSNATYYITQANVPRALPVEDLDLIMKKIQLQTIPFHTVAEAVEAAIKNASNDDMILITGSFFIVAEALAALEPDLNEA